MSPTTPTSASPIRDPNHIPRRRTISSSSGSPCPPRVNIPVQMKMISKVPRHPADKESYGIPTTSPKLQTRKPKTSKVNPIQQYQKENISYSFVENELLNNTSHHDVLTRRNPKVGSSNDSKLKHENRAPFTTKQQSRLKGNAVFAKSPSPPPLPPPNTAISPLSSNIEENARDRKHKKLVEDRRPQGAKDKQYLKPSKMALTKNQLGKENVSSKVKNTSRSPIAKGNDSTTGHKNKIRLPYDTEFCCDDDKFHLLGLEAAKKDSVSIL